ncbi:hypothetical protein QR680_010108 [Steinernema hermaphroditum]|uniref:N-acetyltransferase domain-containing protein n=1 Tax=Steinernema hermaphroditum TaxID=289476 RepID=A0AA39IPP2_9BILA|nr:hypothetical protein QR680_010108 [Steinernema hermaphroditum]
MNWNNWKIVKLTMDDVEETLDFICKDFLHREPLNVSVNLTRDEAEGFLRDIIVDSLQYPFNYSVRNAHNEIIGVRTCNVHRRPRHGEIKSIPVYNNWKCNEIAKIVTFVENKIWAHIPADVDCVASITLLSVDKNYCRKGIGQTLAAHYLAEMEAFGCKGVMAELSAASSQLLYTKKLGYSKLFELLHKDWLDSEGRRIFKCTDGTESCMLVYKPF